MTAFSLVSVSTALALNLLLMGSSTVPEASAFAPSVLTYHTTSRHTSLYMSASTSAAEFELPEDLPNNGKNGNNHGESSAPDGTCPLTEARRLRLSQEAKANERFVQGEELHQLRQHVLELREDLETARMSFATDRVTELERAILQAQQVDAEYVYQVAQERLSGGDDALTAEERAMWERESEMARSVLPQFHLEGLWVGKYSEEGGFELINVTYHGDTLVAQKITTNQQQANVPKGQVTFQVDLSPISSGSDGASDANNNNLEPIELGEGAARQWGSKYLSRFAGQGQVAAQGHRNAQFIDGHLILVGEYFSFAWLGIGHQVFFGRPSAELTLQLLKEQEQQQQQQAAGGANDGSQEDRAFLTRCWEETELLQDELEVQDNIHHLEQQDYYCMEGCFE